MAKTVTQTDRKKSASLHCAGSLMLLLITWQNGFCGIETRENHVVTAVRKASPAVVNISSQYEIRKNSNPFSGYGMDPRLDRFFIQSDQELPAIQMGHSDDLMIGESVIAIGNPFGFSNTVTTGVGSSVNRSIKTGERVFHKFIQTDASINPGNSGGPLLNINAALIGINTAICAQAQGIGFAF